MSNDSKNLALPNTSSATKTKSWDNYWSAVATITGLFLVGAGSAIGHHMFYNSLEGKSTTNLNHQRWVTRIGTGFAFLFKASLAASVVIARQQVLWKTLRGKKEKLGSKTIDTMFGAASNPLSFRDGKMLWHAKLATFMALVIWMLPLSAIATPGTIIVVSTNPPENVFCLARTVLFDFDTKSTAQKLNTTNTNVTVFELADYLGATYQQPSMLARQIFTVSSFSNRIAIPSNTGLNPTTENTTQWSQPRTDTNISIACGGNCSYNVTFLGPTVNCTEIPSNTAVPWSSHYTNQTVFDSGVWNNNTLWIRYAASTTVNWTDPAAVARLPQNVCSCVNSIARYTVRLDLLGGHFQEPTITDVEILNSTLSTADLTEITYEPNRVLFDVLFSILGGNVVEANVTDSSSNSSSESTPAVDGSISLGPRVAPVVPVVPVAARQVGNTEQHASSISRLSSQGYVSYGPPTLTYEHGKFVNQTEVGATTLASASYVIVPRIGSAIETMAQKMVVSLLAADSSGINPSQPLMEYAALANTTCTSANQKNVYQYSAKLLIESYAPALAVALLMALIGLEALVSNGKALDVKFSTIAAEGTSWNL